MFVTSSTNVTSGQNLNMPQVECDSDRSQNPKSMFKSLTVNGFFAFFDTNQTGKFVSYACKLRWAKGSVIDFPSLSIILMLMGEGQQPSAAMTLRTKIIYLNFHEDIFLQYCENCDNLCFISFPGPIYM